MVGLVVTAGALATGTEVPAGVPPAAGSAGITRTITRRLIDAPDQHSPWGHDRRGAVVTRAENGVLPLPHLEREAGEHREEGGSGGPSPPVRRRAA